MALLLRVVKQSRWIKLDWFPAGAIQSDALRDLQTTENTLSLYRVNDRDEFENVVVGLASNRERIQNLDYVILNEAEIRSAGIIPVRTDGETPCNEANILHYNLQELTVEKVAKLAQFISVKHLDRIPRKTIESKVRNAMALGLLDSSKIKDSLLHELTPSASTA